MHTPYNTLPETIRDRSCDLLNERLAAAIDLHGRLKQAHGNVRGSKFISTHELSDKIAGDVERCADQIAERAARLGAIADSKVQVVSSRSVLSPYPLRIADEKAHLFAVPASAGDTNTADRLTEISRSVDRHIWQVQSHSVRP